MGRFHELLRRVFTKTYLFILFTVFVICIIAAYFEYTGMGFDRAVVNFNSRFSGALCTMSLTHLFVTTRIKKVLEKKKYDPLVLIILSIINLTLAVLLFAFTEVYLLHSVIANSLGESPAHATAYFIFTTLVYALTIGFTFHVCYVLDKVSKSVQIKFKES